MNGAQPPPPYAPELGPVNPPKNDPAWQPPTDPLKSGKVRTTARVMVREIPLVTIGTSWTVPMVRAALSEMNSGVFSESAQLVDTIVGDDRVQATLGSRTAGLVSRPIKFTSSRLPGVDEAKADECLEAWKRVWPRTMTEPVLSELQQWSVMMGFGLGQLLWDTSEEIWCPYVRIFHPRFTYFHWTLRALVAITMDGQQQVTPGDGHWLLHAPHGEYRGWMRGAVRAVAQPWLIRALAYRDWARWSERHGFPIPLGKTPAGADDQDKTRWLNAIANLGQESVIEVPQGVDAQFGYGVEYLEAKDGSWQGFDGIIQRCEMSIVLALLWQNLSTEVKEGSFAAARVHADVRQAALEADARALSQTIYTQIARPFAAINFGDPNLAPMTNWDLTPYDDNAAAAKTFVDFSAAMLALHQSGVVATDPAKIARTFGLAVEDKDFAAKVASIGQIFKYHLDYGVVSRNQLLASLGLPPVEGGDEPPKPVAGAPAESEGE